MSYFVLYILDKKFAGKQISHKLALPEPGPKDEHQYVELDPMRTTS
jgi:hypothetical protein